ncbi:MAG: trigger factor, partial [Hyphomicrobiales bacterium]
HKEIFTTQVGNQYEGAGRQKVKRQLLDQLDEKYDFELPPTMLEQEFQGIWDQVMKDLEESKKAFADEDTTEEDARAEYMKIAERRVRLGLVLAEIGDKNKIQVTDEEMRHAVLQQAQQYPGQEKEIFEYFQKNPEQLAGIRAPIFEEKVVDYILELATVTEKKVSKEEILAQDEDE